MILHLSMEELENLRWFQHSKDFEPYCTQNACILMLAHGHDAKTISYDLEISLYNVYNYAELYMLGDISKLTDNRYKSIACTTATPPTLVKRKTGTWDNSR